MATLLAKEADVRLTAVSSNALGNWPDAGVVGSQPTEHEQQHYGITAREKETLCVFLVSSWCSECV